MSAPPEPQSPEIITVVPDNAAIPLPDLEGFSRSAPAPLFGLPDAGEATQGTAGVEVVADWPFSPLDSFGLPSPSAIAGQVGGNGVGSAATAFSFEDALNELLPDASAASQQVPDPRAEAVAVAARGDGMDYSAIGATLVANSLALQTHGGGSAALGLGGPAPRLLASAAGLATAGNPLRLKSEDDVALSQPMDIAGGVPSERPPVPGAIVPYDPAFSAQQHLTATPEELVGNIDWAMNIPGGALEFANWDEKEAHIVPPTDMASITDEQLGYIDLKLLMDLMLKAGYTEAQIQATKTRRRKIKNRNSAKGSASKRRVQMNSIANVNKRLVQVVTGLQHQNSQLLASNNNLRQRMDIASRETVAAQAERLRYQAEIDRLAELVKALSTRR